MYIILMISLILLRTKILKSNPNPNPNRSLKLPPSHPKMAAILMIFNPARSFSC